MNQIILLKNDRAPPELMELFTWNLLKALPSIRLSLMVKEKCPSMSKTTLKFLICQGKEGKGAKGPLGPSEIRCAFVKYASLSFT